MFLFLSAQGYPGSIGAAHLRAGTERRSLQHVGGGAELLLRARVRLRVSESTHSQSKEDFCAILFVAYLIRSTDSRLIGSTAYQLLHRSINRQVANMAAKNEANLALSPTFR
ncbi:hypothetical protein TNCV_4705671 [Trichonephila clavipes]|nr:hypothetical protein TNCV_4705671 [Trichonephila clavipes]